MSKQISSVHMYMYTGSESQTSSTYFKTNIRCGDELTPERFHLLQTQLQTGTAAARDSQGTLCHHVTVVLHSIYQIPGPQCLPAANPEESRR